MNPQEDPRFLIVALKGLPISIAATLCKYPQPVTQTYLCDLLNCSGKTMTSALHRLEEFQILSHSPEGWRVTGNVTLLGLSLPEWLQETVEAVDACPVDTCPVDTCPVDTCPVENPVEKGRKFSTSNPLTTTSNSSIKLINKKLKKNLVLVVDPELKIKPKAEPESEPAAYAEQEQDADAEPGSEPKPKSEERIRECHQAAIEAGIGEPKATVIAELPYTTPEMIEQHVRAALDEGQKIGLAIHRLEKNQKLKNTGKRSASEQEIRDRENRQKYVKGKYSTWVNH